MHAASAYKVYRACAVSLRAQNAEVSLLAQCNRGTLLWILSMTLQAVIRRLGWQLLQAIRSCKHCSMSSTAVALRLTRGEGRSPLTADALSLAPTTHSREVPAFTTKTSTWFLARHDAKAGRIDVQICLLSEFCSR